MPPAVAEQVKSSPAGATIRSFAEYLPREMASHLAWHFDPQAFTGMTVPTTYLTGSLSTEEGGRAFIPLLRDVLPKFSVKEIPGQSHWAHDGNPTLLAKMILEIVGV